ncbi:phosphoribosylglycinamide formyltransferase [Entomortierella parvispora]|uniref:Phosphoribosylglycinamide formyltransferase n=1 Tax=Entomortierella parvispora TaxID=205924 RepID=A0A9P3HE82_9FUNG|nr:phosphoribosylglycinamide formyltransferase [Entomortierella parvispora]
MAPRVVVLISGTGSNLQALIDAIAQGTLKAEIPLVISNRSKVFGLERAAKAGIPTKVHALKPYTTAGKPRTEYDADLAQLIVEAKPDLVVLAGFMHILSPAFLDQFPSTPLINLHPALPGQFDGARAIERAFEAFQKGEIKHTGVMVHRVIQAVDGGEPLLVKEVEIKPEDDLAALQERIHSVEHVLLVQGASLVLEQESHKNKSA